MDRNHYRRKNETQKNKVSRVSPVVKLKTLDDYKRFKKHSKTIILYGAEWCEACKDIYSFYRKLAYENKNKIHMAYVDVDKLGLNINSLPLFVFYSRSNEICKFEGAMKNNLEILITRALKYKK